MAEITPLNLKGCKVYKGYLDKSAQHSLLGDVRSIVGKAPLFSPMTPWGKPMSVKMTSAGKYGWYSDKTGYRYSTQHPNGVEWPEIPLTILKIWNELCPDSPRPECCLVNFYQDGAKMGLHQDKDEKDFSHPVLSISLGDDALFRMGGVQKNDSTESVWLSSGDILVMGGESRLAYHGIDRVKFGSSQLLKAAGRINLTLRVVD
ncbi:alpha-ketoglutarate-dependent dioxygenase AlkB [Amylibacter sp. SFDW26]|uniref:alpha-ketoglutarate-dependent dioxygenase AlkB family protein n=1 Tax=Amylibacter sp. SFDW26 TaxID=2652722 RepID=UPI0012629688|nr:alpha-ketoglutarate-dependent dioxygenase AlkB [Amylibacter sp. SFDW26]KAB7614550.1 alpha-ketoglutarate-dependent dioxygenase AlkB [Amylibacter sp. SFDW26]